jgi:hypothetical protein
VHLKLSNTEHQAFSKLFDRLRSTLQGAEHRIVDPVKEVIGVFFDKDEAKSFVRRLEDMRLLIPRIVREPPHEEDDLTVYMADPDTWLKAISTADITEDSPFRLAIRKLNAATQQRQQEIADMFERKNALEAELAGIVTGIDARQTAISKALELRERLVGQDQEYRQLVEPEIGS